MSSPISTPRPESPSSDVNELFARGIALEEDPNTQAHAIAVYQKVLELDPAHAAAHINLGTLYYNRQEYPLAERHYRHAIEVDQRYALAYFDLGNVLDETGRLTEAVEAYRSAIAIAPNYADAHYNRSLSLLIAGDYARGFEQYEWRSRRSGMPPHRRELCTPLWLGQYAISGKTILLHAEQGLGDTIQFVRYVLLLARAGAKVVVEAQPELAGLLATVDGIDRIIARGEKLPVFDFHCPMPSLPLAFRTRIDGIPAEIPYLRASAERLHKWRPRMASLGKPCIALAWSGNPAHTNDRHRSMALPHLDPLLATPGVRFLGIQRELRAGEAELLGDDRRIVHLGGEMGDFTDTAAVIALADLVISVDTAVAHLAGAMGKPVWVLLPFAPDWRWMLDREDCPWYPTARLFRQPATRDWESVITCVQTELTRLFGETQAAAGY